MANKNQYIYGSAAPQMPQRQEREAPVRKEQASRPLRVAPVYANVPKAKLFFAVIVMVAMCFTILHRFSVLAEMNYQMGTLTKKYNSLRDENRLLKVQIESSINLNRVKQIAEQELGMHKPDRFQVIPVNVPKNNYSVVLDEQYIQKAKTKSDSVLENAVNALKAVFP